MTVTTDRAVQHYTDAMTLCGVKEGWRDGLARYLTAGVQPGAFLLAVLEHDLPEVLNRVDSWTSLAELRDLVRFLHDECPYMSFGNRHKVEAWLHSFQKNDTR